MATTIGDLILFEHKGQLMCHPVVGHPRTVLAQGDVTSSSGQQIGRDQPFEKVVASNEK